MLELNFASQISKFCLWVHGIETNTQSLTRLSAINRLIEQQRSTTRDTRTMKEENEGIRNRVSNIEALVLERTLSSIKGLQNICL